MRRALVQNRIATLPTAWSTKRSHIEMFTVTLLWRMAVSAEIRLSRSPVRWASKKPISCAMIRSKSCLRRRATTRSPASVNRYARKKPSTPMTTKSASPRITVRLSAARPSGRTSESISSLIP